MLTDFSARTIVDIDLSGVARPKAVRAMQRLLNDEHMRAHGKPFDFTGWVCGSLGTLGEEHLPRQRDGYNCGVFAMLLIWCLAYGAPIRSTVAARDMNGWRRIIILWLMQGYFSLEDVDDLEHME